MLCEPMAKLVPSASSAAEKANSSGVAPNVGAQQTPDGRTRDRQQLDQQAERHAGRSTRSPTPPRTTPPSSPLMPTFSGSDPRSKIF